MLKTAALALVFAALPALAGVAKPLQTVRLAYGQKSATLRFETGDGTSFTKARALCDCTELEYRGGSLVAEVDTSTFDAPVDKQIEVTTSDGRKTMLTMRFDVPLAVVFSSPSLIWQRGAAATAQEFRISIPKGSPVRGLKEAGISGEDFDFEARTIRPGAEYAVSVTPRSTAKRCLNRLVIKMDSAEARFSQRILYLQVK